jgi:acetamidase/formamidase
MALYTLEPEVGTLHGSFSRELPPILTINPGDTVRYRTLDAVWNVSPPKGQDRSKWHTFPNRDPERDRGHALIGPIAIRGAKPGMTLAVQIDAIEPGSWGWNAGVDWWETRNEPDAMDPVEFFFWDIDKKTETASNQLGQTIRIKPFMGVLGMPPDEAGWHSTTPPRVCGGNIDCKELVAGSTLYLPIPVKGAYFSTGDGHARQADGEVSGTGIECPMDRVELTFDLYEDLKLESPRANTPAGWITLAFDPDLNKAFYTAMWSMIDLMTELHGITRLNALSLASLVVEMRVTQRVNGTNGVHALLPHDAVLNPVWKDVTA